MDDEAIMVNRKLLPIASDKVLRAIGFSIAIWVAFAVIRSLARRYTGWPDQGAERAFLYFALCVSAVPIALLLLEFISSRAGVIGGKWLTIDFSKSVLEQTGVRRVSFGLPDNIIAEQERITDSGGVKIKAILKNATQHDVVWLDIKDGDAWWVSRLLALCAGAVAVGAPRAVVFVGRRENVDGRFLGWATPSALLHEMLSNPEYAVRFQKAKAVASQLAIFAPSAGELLPSVIHSQVSTGAHPAQQPVAISLAQAVASHQYLYEDSEAATLAAILIAELRGEGFSQAAEPRTNLEAVPDRLTSGRLSQLFDHCLYRDLIDRSWSNEKQIAAFLETTTQYVALVRGGRYEALLQADLGQRAILRGLFRDFQQET
jgi:hypothetical protein